VKVGNPETVSNQLARRLRRVYAAEVGPGDSVGMQATHWFSKHGVLTDVVSYLLQTGWSIAWTGDAVRRDRLYAGFLVLIGEPIHDVEAKRDGVRLLVEAVGHPGSFDGAWDGSKENRSGIGSQQKGASGRYSDALWTGPAMRKMHPEARIVQAFPAHGLYRSHAPRAYGSPHMQYWNVELWMVQPDGTIRFGG